MVLLSRTCTCYAPHCPIFHKGLLLDKRSCYPWQIHFGSYLSKYGTGHWEALSLSGMNVFTLGTCKVNKAQMLPIFCKRQQDSEQSQFTGDVRTKRTNPKISALRHRQHRIFYNGMIAQTLCTNYFMFLSSVKSFGGALTACAGTNISLLQLIFQSPRCLFQFLWESVQLPGSFFAGRVSAATGTHVSLWKLMLCVTWTFWNLLECFLNFWTRLCGLACFQHANYASNLLDKYEEVLFPQAAVFWII